MLELRHDVEGSFRELHSFCKLLDKFERRIAQKLGRLMDMQDAVRINSHEPSTGCVSGYRIVGQNNRAEQTRSSIQRSVSLHTNDTVGDHKMDRDSRAQIDDALLDSFPTETILPPPLLPPCT